MDYRGEDITNATGGNENNDKWNPVRCTLSQSHANKVISENWLWGGVFFEVNAVKSGTVSKNKKIGFSDVQPIYGPYISDNNRHPRLILPAKGKRSEIEVRDRQILLG